MVAREILSTLAVGETADDTRRAVIQRRAVRSAFFQSSVDAPANDLGERHALLAGLRAQAPSLLFGELDLRSDHAEA